MQRECFLSRSNPNCPECGGSGEVVYAGMPDGEYAECSVCGGTGSVATTADPEIPENIITSDDALPALRQIANKYRADFIALETFNLANKMSVLDPSWFDRWTEQQRLKDALTRSAMAFAAASAAFLELVEIDHA